MRGLLWGQNASILDDPLLRSYPPLNASYAPLTSLTLTADDYRGDVMALWHSYFGSPVKVKVV